MTTTRTTAGNRNLCLCLFLLILQSFQARAQPAAGIIRGSIVDDARNPLSGISVGLEGSTLGSPTDEGGHFVIRNVPPGAYTLVATGVGYSASKQNVRVNENQEVSLQLRLNPVTHQLEEIVVQSYAGRSYGEPVSGVASRTATPLRDIPQSVQVLSQQVLQDRQVFLLQESIRNVAGVNQHGGYNDFVMRGFRTGPGNFALNGQRLGATSYTPQVTYHLERVEVLRGPASVLYGAANPGGVINMVTKTPQEKAQYRLNLTYGSFGSWRGLGDATGKLTRDGKVLYRLIAGYENSGSVQQFLRTRHYFVSPSVTYRPTQRTDLTLTASYLHQNQEGGGWYNRGIMAPEGDYNILPIRWTHHEQADKMHDYIANVQVQAAHRFSDKFSVHLLGRYGYYDFRQTYHHVRWNSYVPETGLIRREYRDFSDYNHDHFVNAYGVYRLATGPVSHTLLAGIDYGLSDRYYDAKYARTGVPGLDVFNPQYGQGNVADYVRDGFNGTYDQRLRLLGGYLQDQLEILPNLKAVVGLRYDTYLDRNQSVDRQPNVVDPAKPFENSEDASEATALVPRAGLVYQPIRPVSLYASYSQSFEPQYSNLPGSGGPFDPMRGKQWEAGAKGELFGNQLVPAIAFYHIRQVNMLVADPLNPEVMIAGNEATSRGMELSLTGQLDGLNLVANYAYNETRITESPDPATQNPNPWFANAPNHQGNLWAVYSFARGPVKGLGIGAGLYATGKRYSNFPGFSVPGYRTLDALVKYQRQGFTVAANLYNLTDERYISATFNNRDSIFPGAPRNFRLSIGYTFP